MKRKFKFSLILAFIIFTLVPFKIFAATTSEQTVNLQLFYGQECPHCHDEILWLEKYLSQNPDIKLEKYEVWHNTDNQKKFAEVQKKLATPASGVPYLVIDDQVIIGFISTQTPSKIEQAINAHLSQEINENDSKLNLPIIGKIDTKTISLPLLAMIIGIIDGFNPCAMWILIFLITMLFGMKDRKKMWILGLVFLITSAVVYLLFMISWLNLAVFMNKITLIRILIASFAIIFGGINIYKYFKSKDKTDACDVVDHKQRKKIMNSIRHITSEQKFILAIFGIMTLAVAVNIIELLCSLGLPVVFTQILSLNQLTKTQYAVYLLIYITFFLIDDLIVFFIAMKTLKITAFSTKYAKYSHLIGGLIMLIIGGLMILKSEWLMFNF